MKKTETDYDQLNSLFNRQMRKIELSNCPEDIVESFQNKKNEMFNQVLKLNIPDGNIPFISVIPQYSLDIYRLMEMLWYNGEDGYSSLNPAQIKSEIKVPNEPYFICNVGGGSSLLGKSTKRRWRAINREPKVNHLRVAEAIAFCAHTGILSKHEIDCTASYYGNDAILPTIYVDRGRAKLSWKRFETLSIWWEPINCQLRI